jgi:hypothetical protein
MSQLNPRKPLPKAPVKLDLAQAETLKCDECENVLFIQSFMMKRVSALMSPSGKEELLQIPIMSCGNCGAVNADMLGDLNPDELK